MAQSKDSPNKPRATGGNLKSAGAGGGKGAKSAVKDDPARNTSVKREKASPSGRQRGETSHADRA